MRVISHCSAALVIKRPAGQPFVGVFVDVAAQGCDEANEANYHTDGLSE
jgi:hypothetical protein